jgi:hypothetical protein
MIEEEDDILDRFPPDDYDAEIGESTYLPDRPDLVELIREIAGNLYLSRKVRIKTAEIIREFFLDKETHSILTTDGRSPRVIVAATIYIVASTSFRRRKSDIYVTLKSVAKAAGLSEGGVCGGVNGCFVERYYARYPHKYRPPPKPKRKRLSLEEEKRLYNESMARVRAYFNPYHKKIEKLQEQIAKAQRRDDERVLRRKEREERDRKQKEERRKTVAYYSW